MDWERQAERARAFESWAVDLNDRANDDPSFATYIPVVDTLLDRLERAATSLRERAERRTERESSS